MFKKILIANRGEIAIRIQLTCKKLGIRTVVVYSEADKNSKYVELSDESICIGPSISKLSYLNILSIISAAEVTNSEAIHPGYGFLSENANFAEIVERSGFVFIGPRPNNIRLMGNKVKAKESMKKAGIPVVPGSNNISGKKINEIFDIVRKIKYPVIIKASFGGGGKGMKVVNKESELLNKLKITKLESKYSFSSSNIYIEKFLKEPRHIEIQILSDNNDNVIWIGERDCSIQRMHQKIIEESPSLGINRNIIEQIGDKCKRACKYINYRGVGTFEFLYEKEKFYFIEMNTRIQVEHTVTEMITGIDLIQKQILIASRLKISIKQKDVFLKGYAIECRINAEDPFKFTPSPGKINYLNVPLGSDIRIDSHIFSDISLTSDYDSMIAKIISFGKTRYQAIYRMKIAISEMIIVGIKSNILLHKKILSDLDFIKGKININYLKNRF